MMRRYEHDTDIYSHRLHSEKQLEQRTLDDSSQAYDRNLLSRIGGPNTPHRSLSLQESPATRSPELSEAGASSTPQRLPVPDRQQSYSEGLSAANLAPHTRWTSVTAPASDVVTIAPPGFRSPNYDMPEFSRPALTRRTPSLTSTTASSAPRHRTSHDSMATIFPLSLIHI